MADVLSVGAIGTEDILRLNPSDDKSDERIHDFLCPYLDLKLIIKQSRV